MYQSLEIYVDIILVLRPCIIYKDFYIFYFGKIFIITDISDKMRV